MAHIVFHTEPHPEDNAMLQALYSRSNKSVLDHIQKLKEVGSGKFMSQFYLGYGHASIADCGFITIYIEGVSMLAAKAIQDDELYNGQESSSRYIDWSHQHFIHPFLSEDTERSQAADELMNWYRDFYVTQKPVIIEHLKGIYARRPEEKESVYEKAIAAKAFDILRGYLPCGASTNVAWTTSLRKANERLKDLALHPLKEVRDVAKQIHAKAIGLYPNSIGELPDYETANPYLKAYDHYYSDFYDDEFKGYSVAEGVIEIALGHHGFFDDTRSENNPADPKNRPRKARLAKHNPQSQERIVVDGDLDFGSFRDIQRHRANYCGMPIVNAIGGLHYWYYDQLPEESKIVAQRLFDEIDVFINKYVADVNRSLEMQYLLPMGTVAPLTIETSIKQAVYLAELRSGQTVHATLRPVAQAIGTYLENNLKIPTTTDFSEDEWNVRRGTQDIVSK